ERKGPAGSDHLQLTIAGLTPASADEIRRLTGPARVRARECRPGEVGFSHHALEEGKAWLPATLADSRSRARHGATRTSTPAPRRRPTLRSPSGTRRSPRTSTTCSTRSTRFWRRTRRSSSAGTCRRAGSDSVYAAREHVTRDDPPTGLAG